MTYSARRRELYRLDRENVLARQRARYRANPYKKRGYSAAYYEDHREAVLARQNARNALKRSQQA